MDKKRLVSMINDVAMLALGWHFSQNGFEEDNWHNNHGTYFDLQAASFALFSG